MRRPPRFSSNTVRTVGALLPRDVLAKILDGKGLDGLGPEAYGLAAGARLRDAINDSWNEGKALWWRFQKELQSLSETATATSLTRDKWTLPLLSLLGFDNITTNSTSINIADTDYPISHTYHHSPLHLMGARVELDGRSTNIPGAARLSPHSLTQQFLNRSEAHLWGIVSNGWHLRLVRDSVSLTRQAYVEFDLEAMFSGEVFPDFNLLYRTLHATRFQGNRPEECLLEDWITAARESGIAARDQLRDGVELALTTLGTGFLAHPDNTTLRQTISNGELADKDFYRHLLRLVYRLLFLFVAEDRDLLHTPDTEPRARDLYARYYSTQRLRVLAARPTTTQHHDLWASLTALMGTLGKDEGEPLLGLPALGSFLWHPSAIGPLSTAHISNTQLLQALHHLAYLNDNGNVRRIDFVALGAEELGSVYESLLELHPHSDNNTFTLQTGAGSDRKTTGSYYTPANLISELLDSALDPVLHRAVAAKDPERAILDLKVLDPAAGSGHFLIAAAHRLAKALAEVRSGEPEPPSDLYRTALRDVIAHCLFAVDINDLAVELCKVSLWIETLEPGKPLSFLDHHIVVGNSLFGATPVGIAAGIPDSAFTYLKGDDKSIVSSLKKRNKKERASGESPLTFSQDEQDLLTSEIMALDDFKDDDLETVHAKEATLADWKSSSAYAHAKRIADSWCAAFVISKCSHSPVLTHATFLRIRDEGEIEQDLAHDIEELAQRYSFLHWHLAFPQVFHSGNNEEFGSSGWSGGFDVVLGNPPWDQVQYDPRETFAVTHPQIAGASSTTKRNELIAALESTEPAQHARHLRDIRTLDGFKHFAHASGIFPLSSVGNLNTAPLFVEQMWSVLSPAGRLGVVAPTGIATNSFTQGFFNAMVGRQALVSLYDFENRKKLFPSVHSRYKFCLLTLTGAAAPADEAQFVFFAHDPSELDDPDRRFSLTGSDFALLNPNTRTCPVFRTQRDAEITKAIYRRVPVLIDEARADGNPWGASLQVMFMMNTDSHLFWDRPSLEMQGGILHGNQFHINGEKYLPLYEGKMIGLFDHRSADVIISETATMRQAQPNPLSEAEKRDPARLAMPRAWVPESEIQSRARPEPVVLSFRNVTSSTNERTMIATALPRAAIGNSLQLIHIAPELIEDTPTLLAILSSYVYDFVVRQKIGGVNLNFYLLEQTPILSPTQISDVSPWSACNIADWLTPRVVELVRTADDVVKFGAGTTDQPLVYKWDSSRRQILRAEIDAAMFRLYDIDRDSVGYIMDTFHIVKRRDLKESGEYLTKDLILGVFDELAAAEEQGTEYQSPLDPPPADRSLGHIPSNMEPAA